MRAFGPRRLALDDRLAVDAALEEAFAPLRVRTANISAARVRAAVRWERPAPTPLSGFALLARIGELSTAAVISALVFGSSLVSVQTMPDGTRDAAQAGEWVLNGRAALQRPIDSRATDYRTIAGDIAVNAATVRREATGSDRGGARPEQASFNQ